MQAVILAGGEGTRLRPLTSSVPKPVVTLVDRPFITYMIEWLKSHGVNDVVMCNGFLADRVREVMGDGADLGVKLRYVDEKEPLGTAGAIKLAQRHLEDRFLVLNGDVLTDMDLTAQIEQHERTEARLTLALIGVPDPSAYGLVRLEQNKAVREFVEKPDADQIDTNMISAGAYVIEKEVLSLIEPDKNTSWEREIFPQLIDDGLFGYEADGYWLDIGTPDRYLEAVEDILSGRVKTGVSGRLDSNGRLVEPGAEMNGEVRGPAIIESGAKVASDASIGPSVVLGVNVTVASGSVIERSVVLEGAEIEANTRVRDAIICPGAKIGAEAQISGNAIIGTGVDIEPGRIVEPGARIFPEVTSTGAE